MNPSGASARRATVDDLPSLRLLWKDAQPNPAELEKRITDFQVCMDAAGTVLGAMGLKITGKQGVIHSVCIRPGSNPSEIKNMLWQRVMTLARNHGLVRIWAAAGDPWLGETGFTAAEEQILKKLPADSLPAATSWSVLTLKDETEDVISMEREFELFQQAQRESSERVLKQARYLKAAAMVLLVIACSALAVFMFQILKKSPVLFDLMNRK